MNIHLGEIPMGGEGVDTNKLTILTYFLTLLTHEFLLVVLVVLLMLVLLVSKFGLIIGNNFINSPL